MLLAEGGPGPLPGTIGGAGGRVRLYPREIAGTFTRARTRVAWLLLALFLGLPWLEWRGEPLFRIDVLGHKLDLGPWHFWPQDMPLVLPGALAFVLFVFFVTARYGRVWCGWACPQTVFLQFLFQPVERLIEGRSARRRKRDQAPPTAGWMARKVLKHLVFLVLASIVGNSLLAYFWGMENLLWAAGRPPAENWGGFVFMAGFTLVFYWVFAWFREQACVIVCPYAKFQSVLADSGTTQVAYDRLRGEPRGRPPGGGRSGLGDCVDCRLCVQVCPTGIDIRDGAQLECLGCARCVDACDKIMAAWKKPAGLVRHASLEELERRPRRQQPVRHWIYAGFSLASGMLFLALVWNRPVIALDLARTGRDPYVVAGDTVRNSFTLDVRNRETRRRIYRLELSGADSLRHNWRTRAFDLGGGQRQRLPLEVSLPRSEIAGGKRIIRIRVRSETAVTEIEAPLIGPLQGPGGGRP